MEKFGAMSTPVSGEASSQPLSCARRSSVQPVVPTTRVDAVPTQKSRLPITEAGVVSSTATWAPVSARVSSLSPRPRAATSSMSSAASTARTASEPIRPLAPRTATRSLLIVLASLPECVPGGSGDGLVQPGRLLVLQRADDRQRGTLSQDVAGDRADVVRGDRRLSGPACRRPTSARPSTARSCRCGSSARRCPPGRGRWSRRAGRWRGRSPRRSRPCSATWSSSSRQIFSTSWTWLGPAARVDAEEAAVGEARGVRVHAVGEAALLPDLLEEPGAHAAAEGGVEHAERPAAVVGAGQARHAEDDVGLLGLAVEQLDAARGAQRRGGRRAGRRARRRRGS